MALALSLLAQGSWEPELAKGGGERAAGGFVSAAGLQILHEMEGRGGERRSMRGLFGLLLGGRSWRQQNTPSPQLREGPPLAPQRSSPRHHGRLHGQGRGRRGKAQDPHLAGCKQVLTARALGLEAGFFSWLPTPSLPGRLKRSSRSQGWPRLCPRRGLEERVQETSEPVEA